MCFRNVVLIIDGTFKVAPHLFTQLLTVHGLTTDGYRLPLTYGLLPGKRQEMYCNLLNELDTNGPLQPLTVLADFEMGLRNAISTTWPNAAIRGCYFHFKQCLRRNLDRLGLTYEYQVFGSDIRRSFQNIGALPFLPIEDVGSLTISRQNDIATMSLYRSVAISFVYRTISRQIL